MIVASTISVLREQVARHRRAGERIAFVPTMGSLHAGHLRLMSEARQRAPVVTASIYINPLQFSANEDFDAYPRTPEEDRVALESVGVDVLFMPGDREMYARSAAAVTRVEVPGLGDILCGAFRPGHFQGVATVVTRLFNLVQPDVAIFGKKDYQQLMVVRRMVEDLGMPVEIIGVETVRESDGLALSSRNRYLAASERALAPRLYKTLDGVRKRMLAGATPLGAETWAMEALRAAGFRPDYVSVRRQADLAPPEGADRGLVVLAAAWLGKTRLIDNLEFHLD
ncbi:MAG: pantoate--beta-alanine ligase [Acidithiobacillales bacterium SM1_46]|jgi:pantoate--beta-alanine ligase|nr:MAG: pantoate--beta-alanine ligase [Acidithiobacillales bacterium SM1_46]